MGRNLSQTVTDFASDVLAMTRLEQSTLVFVTNVGLETDISKCFDQIAHQPLLKKLNTSPSIARQIRAWLKAGMIDNFHYCETSQGVPQGGCLSP